MNITTKTPNLARKLEVYNSSFEAFFKNYGLKTILLRGDSLHFFTLHFCLFVYVVVKSVVKRYTKLHFLHKIKHFFQSYTIHLSSGPSIEDVRKEGRVFSKADVCGRGLGKCRRPQNFEDFPHNSIKKTVKIWHTWYNEQYCYQITL